MATIRFTNDEFTKAVGQLIREAREEKGLSQSELAEAVDRRQAAISAIENGKMDVDATTLIYLAVFLRKPVSYFFPGYIRSLAGEEGDTEEEKALLKAFRSLYSSKYRRLALKQVQNISNWEIEEDFGDDEKAREFAFWYEEEEPPPQ